MKKISLVILVSIVLFTVWLSGCFEQEPGVITSIRVSQETEGYYRDFPLEIVYEVNKTQDGIHFKFYKVYRNYTIVNREGLILESEFENIIDFIESVNFSSFEDVYESERCYGGQGRSGRTDRVIVRYSNQSVEEVSACYDAGPDDFYSITYLVRNLEYKVITNNITFNIKNNLDESIYSGYIYGGIPINIFRYDDGNWTQLGVTRPCPACLIAPGVYEFEPGENLSFVWDGTYYEYVTGIDFIQRDAEPERYKAEFCYSTYDPRAADPNVIVDGLMNCLEKEFSIPYTEGIIDITVGEEELAFEEVMHGVFAYFVPEDKDLVIKDFGEWCLLYDRIFPPPGPTAGARGCLSINFSEKMVIAVFMGGKGSGGYSIAVKSIIYDYNENTLIVNVERVSPGLECPVTLALTSPFQVVKTTRSDKTVEFRYSDHVTVCE